MNQTSCYKIEYQNSGITCKITFLNYGITYKITFYKFLYNKQNIKILRARQQQHYGPSYGKLTVQKASYPKQSHQPVISFSLHYHSQFSSICPKESVSHQFPPPLCVSTCPLYLVALVLASFPITWYHEGKFKIGGIISRFGPKNHYPSDFAP